VSVIKNNFSLRPKQRPGGMTLNRLELLQGMKAIIYWASSCICGVRGLKYRKTFST
jgi:hypothetical protein